MSTTPDPPAVDVAIVNWNTPEAAGASARAFLASTDVTPRLTVIDNDSAADAKAELESRLPAQARLILSQANLGFGAGANLALRDGDAELVCVSNADVVPEPGALAALAEASAERRDAGMVGPAFADESAYHARLPSPGALALRPLIGGFRHRSVRSPGNGSCIEVGQPAGACFLMRRRTWEQVGGFDEGFFLWYEDVDLARRLRDAGLRNYVCGAAVVSHRGGLAADSMSDAERQAARLAGLRRYLEKHHPRTGRLSAPLFALGQRLRVGRS
ncbi:MAG: glycosyltransferase family 2 protein [Solirubrobacterales bacterium]